MSTKKKSTKKEEAPPFEQRIQDMFTTDPEKIRSYIAVSPRTAASLDPDTILKINHQVQKRVQGDFTEYMHYFNTLNEETADAMMRFQCVLDPDPRVAKILKKKYVTEEELLYLSSWTCTHNSDYYHFMNPDHDPHPFDESDYI